MSVDVCSRKCRFGASILPHSTLLHASVSARRAPSVISSRYIHHTIDAEYTHTILFNSDMPFCHRVPARHEFNVHVYQEIHAPGCPGCLEVDEPLPERRWLISQRGRWRDGEMESWRAGEPHKQPIQTNSQTTSQPATRPHTQTTSHLSKASYTTSQTPSQPSKAIFKPLIFTKRFPHIHLFLQVKGRLSMAPR